MAFQLPPCRPPHEGAILVLVPLTERSRQILSEPAHQNRVCQVPGRVQGQENAVGLEIRQGPASGVFLTIGRAGSLADIQLPSLSVAIAQCSLQSLGDGEYMLVDNSKDNSKDKSTRTYGQNAIAFVDDNETCQVLIDRDINHEFGFGGARFNLYQFEIVWCDEHGKSWPEGYDTLRPLPMPADHHAMADWTAYGRRASTRISRDAGRDIAYVFRKWLGGGAFGQVHHVLDVHTGREMALKRVERSWPGTEDWRGTKREVDALKRCSHPHVIEYHRCQSEGNLTLIFMALAQGSVEDLANAGEFARDPGLVDQLLRETLSALVCIHGKGLIHRDIKPANVLYTKSAGVYCFMLAHFGLVAEANVAQTEAGTPMFQAPELRQELPNVTNAIDIWSLFVTIAFAIDAGSLRTLPCSIRTLPLRIRHAATDPRLVGFAHMALTDPRQRPSAATLLKDS